MKCEWEKLKLGDVCNISSSKRIFAKEYTKAGIPFYRGKEIIEKSLGNNVSTELFISQKRYEEIKSKFDVPQKGDILLTSVGTLGVPWLVNEDDFYFKDGNLTWLRTTNKLLNTFLYLWLNSSEAKHQIDTMCIGSTQKALTIDTLKKFEISVPSIQIQEKICSILYPIMDKIELNNAINNNLEQQAFAIFKSWFVDFELCNGIMPSDWNYGTIEDLASEIVCGKTPSTKKKEYYGDDIPFITIPDMHNSVYTVKTERSLSLLGADSQSQKTLPKNSVCVSCIGTAGLVTLVSTPSQTNQQINSIIPKENVSPYFVYLLMKTKSDEINKYGQSGSTIVNLNKTQFSKLECIIPSTKFLIKFNDLLEPIFNKILVNMRENITLADLRDTLLSKLMSGEIDVSNIEL